MTKFNEGISTTPPPKSIPYKSLWKKGRDGKFYATEEDLRRAKEEWLRKITNVPKYEKKESPSLENEIQSPPPTLSTEQK
jgi:hypothetical protein